MIIGIKDTVKLFGISIVSFCAVFVCTLFLNYNMDIIVLKDQLVLGEVINFYNAQVSIAKVISLISGGCLLLTSVVMLFFYIKHYIDVHRKELGILKALGYSRIKIASHFWIFGISVLIGTLLGFCGAFIIMPTFYALQNQDKILPEIMIHFHFSLFIFLVVIPTLFFSLLAILYTVVKLKKSSLELLKETSSSSSHPQKHSHQKKSADSFLDELKRDTVKRKKSLAFFIIFASFCFSSMTQMSMGMDELSSVMMAIMIFVIGMILASTTLFIAISTVVDGNKKTVAMMQVMGYSKQECCYALLDGYRPLAYIGFIIGTIYQYVLIKIVLTVVFKDVAGIPQYHFDFIALLFSLILFIVIYEVVMYCYSRKIQSITIKEIMLE
ncbi:MAG: FtsX-like permease family protein [Longibaculum sp.]